MHSDYASILNNIAVVYYGKGNLDKALEYHYKSLEIMKIVLG